MSQISRLSAISSFLQSRSLLIVWAAKVIKNKFILLNDDEFTDFLLKASTCTAGYFKVNFKGSIHFYLMCTNNVDLTS